MCGAILESRAYYAAKEKTETAPFMLYKSGLSNSLDQRRGFSLQERLFLDLRWGEYQVHITEGDKPKTTCVTSKQPYKTNKRKKS
uniref:Uncharacterized protein n=1 Tax=Utricularia reniformis TaxID=192314 RepID=A0A1Y0AYR7_9LAMI|nr:hypothetical protein AEK19_MT0470 [Utricularia reniformis]ART30291.1 hypothetical protein AEK19_MT0470 [Utricularia reniformis]